MATLLAGSGGLRQVALSGQLPLDAGACWAGPSICRRLRMMHHGYYFAEMAPHIVPARDSSSARGASEDDGSHSGGSNLAACNSRLPLGSGRLKREPASQMARQAALDGGKPSSGPSFSFSLAG